MFAPVVLPFQISLVLALAALALISLTARHHRTATLTAVAVFLLFIPSCVGVMLVVDQFRYGRFEYKTASDVPKDGPLEFPPTAADIVVYKHGAGHYARFQIETGDLTAWVAEMQALRPELNRAADNHDHLSADLPKSLRAEMIAHKSEEFSHRFAQTDWSYDPRMIEYHVSRSDRGGGYQIWHLSETGETYLSAGYW